MPASPLDRMYLVHLQSGDTVSAQYNPTEITEKLEVVWKKVAIRGESHEHYEYEHTKSPGIEFELGFDSESIVSSDRAIPGRSTQGDGRRIGFGGNLVGSSFSPEDDPQLARKWLRALCYTPRGASNIKAAAPSRVLVVFPGLFYMATRLEKVEFTYRQFTGLNDGRPTLFSAKLTFGADFDRRLYYEDVLEFGTELHDSSGNFIGN